MKKVAIALAIAALLTTGVTNTVGVTKSHAADVSRCHQQTLFSIFPWSNTYGVERYVNTQPSQPNFMAQKTQSMNDTWRDTRIIAVDSGPSGRRLLQVKTTGDDAGILYAYNYDINDISGIQVPIRVGHGFNNIQKIFGDGNNVFWAIDSEGYLRWYKWNGAGYDGGQILGHGWGSFTKVFSGGNGVIYAVEPNGDLQWYRYTRSDSGGGGEWYGPRKIGHGWGGMHDITGGGDGLIYARSDQDGRLYRYNHLAPISGEASWSGPDQLPGDFSSHTIMAADPSACSAGSSPNPPSPPNTDAGPIPLGNWTGGTSPGNGYAWGNCTFYAFERRLAYKRPIGGFWGNAGGWAAVARSKGFAVDGNPRVGDIFEVPGHVGIVERVNNDGTVFISEMNYQGYNIVSTRTINISSATYIH